MGGSFRQKQKALEVNVTPLSLFPAFLYALLVVC